MHHPPKGLHARHYDDRADGDDRDQNRDLARGVVERVIRYPYPTLAPVRRHTTRVTRGHASHTA